MLSVIVPVYNEEATINALLQRLRDGPYPDKEIIVVDDGSSDGTSRILDEWRGVAGMVLLAHGQNKGKGAAIQTGLKNARGDIVIIQDADLEYDPANYPRLIKLIQNGESDVVYGSRYLDAARTFPMTRFRLAVSALNVLVRLLYHKRITDEATCYKAFRTDLLRRLDIRAQRFEFCPEVTAKLCRLGIPIVEVPISYHPRVIAEGKKIGWRDAWPTFWTLVKWRFLPL